MGTKKQNNFLSFLQRKQKEWQQKSLKYYERFQTNHDPEVIIKFVKSSSFALLEDWVMRVIMKWHIEGEYGLLKKIFLPQQGERAEKETCML